MRGIAEGCT